jgi:hypothetical protein
VLVVERDVCVFDKNLREPILSFKIRGSVIVILIDFTGGKGNFLNYLNSDFV